MVGGGFRYFSGAVAFGFAAVWIMATLAAAFVCLLSAAVAYGAVVVAERTRAKRAARGHSVSNTPGIDERPAGRPDLDDLPASPEALNSDLGYVYEPTAATSALAAPPEYGWALDDPTAASSEPLH
jgi:hypothetical protein